MSKMNITKMDLNTYITNIECLDCIKADENNIIILRYDASQVNCLQLERMFRAASEIIHKHNPDCSVIVLPDSTSLETCSLAELNSIADRIIDITKKQNI